MAWEIALIAASFGMVIGLFIGEAMTRSKWRLSDKAQRALIERQREVLEKQDARIKELSDGKE